MKFLVDEEVATDPGSAFDAMADVRNEPRWNDQVSRSELVSIGAIAKGSRFKTVNRGYEYDAVITTYERPSRLEFEVTGQQLDMSVSFRFEAAEANRTRMHGEFDMRPKGIMKLLFPLMTPLVRRDFPKQMGGFKRLFVTVGVVLALILSGSASAQISDSSGVRVITNAAPGANAPTYRLSTRRVAIGVIEGAPEYMLFRVGSGTVLRDGSILIANSGTSEARLYDNAGRYLRTFGRPGEGPGEFRGVSLTGVLAGDSLLLFDGPQNRFSIFTLAGEFVRTISASTEGSFGSPNIHGLLANRRILMSPFTIPTPPPQPSVVRRPVPVVWLGVDGGGVTPFGEFPGTEAFQGVGVGGMPLVFGRTLHVDARGDRIAVANDDTYSIRIYDAAGKLLQVVRERRGPVAVRESEWGEALAPPLRPGAPPLDRPSPFRRNVERQPHLTTRPPWGGNYSCPFSCVRLDQVGNLWVKEYDASYEDDGATWHIFNPQGVFTGVFVVPPRMSMLDSGADWMLVNQKDDLDVEHVVLYGLTRP